MDFSWRPPLATTGLAAIVTLAGGLAGCSAIECSETLTCAIPSNGVVAPNDSGGEANAALESSPDSASASDGTDNSIDSADGDVDPADGDAVTTDSAGDESDAAFGTNDGADESTAVDAGLADAGAARDAFAEAAPEAGPKCVSNVLTPKMAVASSSGTFLPAEAIDNDFTTRWESVQGVDPQWIRVDFGAPVFVNRVQIAWLHSCAANYDLQVSNDAATWKTMRSIVGNTMGGSSPTNWSSAVDHQGLAGVGRYVRVNGTARCDTTFGYSMWEMRVSGDPNVNCSP